MTIIKDFTGEEQKVIEIQCPACGEVGHMVSVERVYQTYPVFFNEDGDQIREHYSIQVKGEDEQ